MASADQLKALIKSHISRDDGHFYSVAMQVAAHEARQGHGRLADELISMLDKGKAKLAGDKNGKLVPLANAAKSRTELGNLLSVSEPGYHLSDVILEKSAQAQLNRLVREQRMMARIREHGLSPRRKVLLVGPPGTGKTLTASALAGELGIPLFQVRFDALITKFMGETAAKLRQTVNTFHAERLHPLGQASSCSASQTCNDVMDALSEVASAIGAIGAIRVIQKSLEDWPEDTGVASCQQGAAVIASLTY